MNIVYTVSTVDNSVQCMVGVYSSMSAAMNAAEKAKTVKPQLADCSLLICAIELDAAEFTNAEFPFYREYQ